MNIDDLLFDLFSDYSSIYVLYLCLRVCWFAWGWIMEATCCLLIYDPELMFDVVDLNMHCFCYEMLHNPAHSYI